MSGNNGGELSQDLSSPTEQRRKSETLSLSFSLIPQKQALFVALISAAASSSSSAPAFLLSYGFSAPETGKMNFPRDPGDAKKRGPFVSIGSPDNEARWLFEYLTRIIERAAL
ncbi:hypothetical protein CEXT_749461 [Caerostris extrusa]|uniref:Uncharacterized protein n=1 Tax=Caerostris extrusa TaxID=172846 RepID=A0AAV4RCJ9_CAEEX|nr:hypothetical protein CEXT_749461 [Caerostris extrusa]